MLKRSSHFITKSVFAEAYKGFLVQQGVKIDGTDPDYRKAYEFFRSSQDFIVSLAATSGGIKLRGIGAFEFVVGGSSGCFLEGVPYFKYYPGFRYYNFFRNNPELVNINGGISGEDIQYLSFGIANQIGKKEDPEETGGELE
jgi:hypothetical protein